MSIQTLREAAIGALGVPAAETNRVFQRVVIVGLDRAAIDRLPELDGSIATVKINFGSDRTAKSHSILLADATGVASLRGLSEKNGVPMQADVFGVFASAHQAKAVAEGVLASTSQSTVRASSNATAG